MQRKTTFLAFALLLATGLACGSNETPNTPASGNTAATSGDANQAPGIKSVTLTNAEGETVTSFKPSDRVQKIAVQFSETSPGKVRGVFTVVNAGGEKNLKLLEKEVELGTLMNTATFSATLDKDFPVGDYKFDVYFGDKLLKTHNYKVQ